MLSWVPHILPRINRIIISVSIPLQRYHPMLGLTCLIRSFRFWSNENQCFDLKWNHKRRNLKVTVNDVFLRNNKIISVALNTYFSGCLGNIFLRHQLGMYCLFLEILHLPIRCFCNSWCFRKTEFQKHNLVYHKTNLSPFLLWDPLRSLLT